MADSAHTTIASPESLLALSERLLRRARRARTHGNANAAADLRLASFHLRKLAGLLIRIDALNADGVIARHRMLAEAQQLAAEPHPHCDRGQQ
jgi:hypothetical protein